MTISTKIPFIPDNAPFTPEQRTWLNGFLAGLFANDGQQAAAAESTPSHRIAVLYASQTGTAEGLARKLAKELKAQGHQPVVSTLVGYSPAALAAENYALIFASTYGDGEAPDGVQPFFEELCLEHFPRFDGLSYSVFALGDRHYEHFCKFGKDLDSKLVTLGANRLADRVDCDVDVNEPLTQWKAEVLPRLNESAAALKLSKFVPTAVAVAERPTPNVSFTRDNPVLAPLVYKKDLTHKTSSKTTLHLAFSIEGTGIQYETGDACGVLPANDSNLVAEILQALRFNGNEQVQCGKAETMPLHNALTHHLQITRLNRKMVAEYANLGKCSLLSSLLEPKQQSELERYLYGRGLIDLLIEYPGVVQSPEELVAMLPKLTPRLYSISSSPLAHAGQIHTTVAVVRYTAHNRERGGVCSTLFADRASISDRLPLYIQPNKRFKLPRDSDVPIIMIGPGTGIAPFRGFLHERRALGAKGRNWLFFGERSATTDYLYRDELEAMQADGHLTRLDTAFSRDQDDKLYVQDRMLEQAPLFWSWLQDGASLYVCGDASRMAKDVHCALQTIVQTQGELPATAAEEYVDTLEEQHRYHRDVY
ncbi:MAG: sulfite reductase flavoprotein subunit alpha [Terracidiphilus sp.]|jgi:sulfite reductase (NADPH) flavoprotein alpha-component